MLHLHAGLALEDERRASCAGARAVERRVSRMCRAWRSRPRFLVAEAEENNLGNKALAAEVGSGGARAACASKDTTASWLCARLGVLEDVRRAAGDGLDRACAMARAWEQFRRSKTPRGRVVRAEAELAMKRRLGLPGTTPAHRAGAMFAMTYRSLRDVLSSLRMQGTYTLEL